MKKTFKQFMEQIILQTSPEFENPSPKKVKPKEHPMVKSIEKKDLK